MVENSWTKKTLYCCCSSKVVYGSFFSQLWEFLDNYKVYKVSVEMLKQVKNTNCCSTHIIALSKSCFQPQCEYELERHRPQFTVCVYLVMRV